MNSWLDTLGPAARTCNPAWRKSRGDGWAIPDAGTPSAIRHGRSVFHWSDVVHGHTPIRAYAPPGTFCFTMLREPGPRLISQFADWRRLTPGDVAALDEAVAAAIMTTQKITLSEFLTRYGEGIARPLVDNYLTRALAASRLGRRATRDGDAGLLLGDALHALHTDYDFIGLVEDFDLSRNALCGLLGLPPCGPAAPLNRSLAAGSADPALRLSDDEAQRFTCHDRILYQAARRLFAARHRALAERYDVETFERDHAAALTSRMRATHEDGAAKYTVTEPIYGMGLHQRDGGFTGPYAVWTISGRRAAIYIPVPAGLPVSLLLWVRGYAEPAQRVGLRVWVDGGETVPAFESVSGYADLIVVPHLPGAGFARLEIEVPVCRTDCGDDARPRGISFDAYGWRPNEEG